MNGIACIVIINIYTAVRIGEVVVVELHKVMDSWIKFSCNVRFCDWFVCVL